jgi:hypothetical protein
VRLRISWTAEDVVTVLMAVRDGRLAVSEAARRLGTKEKYVYRRAKWLDEYGTPAEPEERRGRKKRSGDGAVGKGGRADGVRKAAEGMTFAAEDGAYVRWEPPVVSRRASAAWCLDCYLEDIDRRARSCPECGSDRIVRYWHGDGPGDGQESGNAAIRLKSGLRITPE